MALFYALCIKMGKGKNLQGALCYASTKMDISIYCGESKTWRLS